MLYVKWYMGADLYSNLAEKSANTVVGIYHLVFDPMQEVVGSTGNEQLGQICAAGVAASGKGLCRHRMLRRVY